MEEDEFKSWLVRSKSEDKARCRPSKKDNELSNMGRQALLSHCNEKKHKKNGMKVKSFFHPRRTKANPSKAVETDTACGTSESSESFLAHSKPCYSKMQANLELVVADPEKTKAEILWALKSIAAGYSNSCSDTGVLFQTMFLISKIVKSFHLGPTKLKYLTTFGIALHFKSLLVERLKESHVT